MSLVLVYGRDGAFLYELALIPKMIQKSARARKEVEHENF